MAFPAPRSRPDARSGFRRLRAKWRASTVSPAPPCGSRPLRRPRPEPTACSRIRSPSGAPPLVAGMLRQARIEHAGDARMGRQALREALGAFRLCGRAQVQRAHAAHEQIGLEGTENRALPLADGDDLRPERVGFAPASTPATTSEWPLRTFVAACMTMSAPSDRAGYGRARRWSNRPPGARRPHGRSRLRPRCR